MHSIAYAFDKNKVVTIMLVIKVPHVFYILLRFKYLDTPLDMAECDFFPTVVIQKLSILPWDEKRQLDLVQRLCGRQPLTDLVVEANVVSIQIVLTWQLAHIIVRMQYCAVDMQVLKHTCVLINLISVTYTFLVYIVVIYNLIIYSNH